VETVAVVVVDEPGPSLSISPKMQLTEFLGLFIILRRWNDANESQFLVGHGLGSVVLLAKSISP